MPFGSNQCERTITIVEIIPVFPKFPIIINSYSLHPFRNVGFKSI